jgi:hypothetical protein
VGCDRSGVSWFSTNDRLAGRLVNADQIEREPANGMLGGGHREVHAEDLGIIQQSQGWNLRLVQPSVADIKACEPQGWATLENPSPPLATPWYVLGDYLTAT